MAGQGDSRRVAVESCSGNLGLMNLQKTNKNQHTHTLINPATTLRRQEAGCLFGPFFFQRVFCAWMDYFPRLQEVALKWSTSRNVPWHKVHKNKVPNLVGNSIFYGRFSTRKQNSHIHGVGKYPWFNGRFPLGETKRSHIMLIHGKGTGKSHKIDSKGGGWTWDRGYVIWQLNQK